MRVLVVRPGPSFSVEDVAQGWMEGFRTIGAHVTEFDTGAATTYHEQALKSMGIDDPEQACLMMAANLRQTIFDCWPDLVLVVSAFLIPPAAYDIIRSRNIKVVGLLTESPYEDDAQLPIAAHCDAVLVNDPTNLEKFLEVNPSTWYQPHCYRPTVHRPGNVGKDYQSDFCFVGTGYPGRVEWFEQCDFSGIDVALAGNWQALGTLSPLRPYVAHPLAQCVDNIEAVKLYQGTKASMNLYRTEAQRTELLDGWAMGPREVELAACGTFYLTEERGENREVLPMVPTFDGPEDFTEKLRWWLDHDDERRDVAWAARAAVGTRTFAKAAAELVARLGI
jgi:spore maturation protein CgeB